MNIHQIILILENKINYLNSLKSLAFSEGKLDLYNQYSYELEETQSTINSLKQIN